MIFIPGFNCQGYEAEYKETSQKSLDRGKLDFFGTVDCTDCYQQSSIEIPSKQIRSSATPSIATSLTLRETFLV